MNLIAHISSRDAQRIEFTLLMFGITSVVVVAFAIFAFVNFAKLRKARSEHRKNDVDQNGEHHPDS